jgi:hypothetical protein
MEGGTSKPVFNKRNQRAYKEDIGPICPPYAQ